MGRDGIPSGSVSEESSFITAGRITAWGHTKDTVFRFPYGNFRGHVAPLVCGAAGRGKAVRIGQECRYRKGISPLVGNGLLNVFHKGKHFGAVGQGRIVRGSAIVGKMLPSLRKRYFPYLLKTSVDGFLVHPQDVSAGFPVALGGGFLHKPFGFFGRQQS